MTTPRIYLDKQTPSVFKALRATAAEVRARAAEAGLAHITLELVNLRVSQINRCAYCLDLHTHLALQAGETTQRLAVLPGWRDTQLFSETERAALELAEAVTLVASDHLSDEEYARARAILSDDEISVLLWAAITINAFNRVSILSRHEITRRDVPRTPSQ
ncbi:MULTISPECIES: carboxymuconolactone decarboxylase family protein [Protofrankia]|uniref:Carboxymuconolactone decarboxylase n=1 Tax=Protofrankia coriariae TaxID=1562887 RepID=A0ABR5F1P8_9ACTN|nr:MULTISPECIES: carboxymuconolactone decarboxylase family protein [Protofrankia]KLL10643.1 carboxymuconolactone decarboxylase [Protofrankia coriariae]ONH35075.1 carboxymuconolactone decarboxylase [Protofrankia sp. BMG5.30]